MEIQGLHYRSSPLHQMFLSNSNLCQMLSNAVKSCQMLHAPLLMEMLADNQQMVQRYHVPSSKNSQLPDDTDTIMLWYPEKGDVTVNISKRAGV